MLPGVNSLSVVALVALALVASLLWRQRKQRLKYTKFPIVPKNYGGIRQQYHAWLSGDMFEDGYRMFPDDIHRIPTPEGDHLAIPRRYLDELKDRADDELDFVSAFMKVFENAYTDMSPGLPNVDILCTAVREDLTRNLGQFNDVLSKAVEEAVAVELPLSSDSWTAVHVHKALRKIVAVASGHVLVGPDLASNEDYVRVSVDFTTDLFASLFVIMAWPSWLRPIVGFFMPAVAKLRAHKQVTHAFLAPVLEARRDARRRGENLPPNILQWMLDRCDKSGLGDLDSLAKMLLLLVFSATHTITLAATLTLYDLVARPELLEECREEMRSVLKETGGVINSRALYNMKLLDSVMRESQRMTPPSMEAFRRVVVKNITLNDGTTIPAGCMIEAAVKAPMQDAALFASPDRFDPARFLRLRTDPTEPDLLGYANREQYQFTSVTRENLSFGFGRHVCPGRFFAANQIKMLLTHILLNYDIEQACLAKSEKAPDLAIGPDLDRIFHFKRVKK